MDDIDRGWSVTRPRQPNYDLEPELTIVIRADSWEQAAELWEQMRQMNDANYALTQSQGDSVKQA